LQKQLVITVRGLRRGQNREIGLAQLDCAVGLR
jgi:hypothetical protein